VAVPTGLQGPYALPFTVMYHEYALRGTRAGRDFRTSCPGYSVTALVTCCVRSESCVFIIFHLSVQEY
jgi:hypothetical protein